MDIETIMEVEGGEPLGNPTPEEVSSAVFSLNGNDPSYCVIQDGNGSFVQFLGRAEALTVEWHICGEEGEEHYIVGHDNDDETSVIITYRDGETEVFTSEALTAKEAAPIGLAFLANTDLPEGFVVRDVSDLFG